jgi:hypothetical protein
MGPKVTIHSFNAQSDGNNAQNQVLYLDRTHVFLKDGIEVQVSPSEYVLCKLILIGSQVQSFVPIATLELCFYVFTNPASLKRFEIPLALQTTRSQESPENEVSDLDRLLFSHTLQLLPDRDSDPIWRQQVLSLLCQDEQDSAHLQKQQIYHYIQTFKQGVFTDVRKRISKHISGVNMKLKERGIGIQLFSVGQNKGYMASIASGSNVH